MEKLLPIIILSTISSTSLINGGGGGGSWTPAAFKATQGWHSQVFTIPGRLTNNGKLCAKRSVTFCFRSFRLESEQDYGLSLNSSDEVVKFESLIKASFQKFNWFSGRAKDRDSGGCCSDQVDSFTKFGLWNLLSAQDYMSKATNFITGHKPLNWIKAYFHKDVCANVIVEVGFGGGRMRITGEFQPYADYILQMRNETALRYRPKRLQAHLTFNWFKHNVICVSQNWICRIFHPESGTNI
ncbi:uncharacterized protein LOC142345282 [Convolutriloba macropyga]|uniref:uncharacterized protein LOC142345282 n=1 Tax=Convolutriloba macropyga TaxID=536237 RepID=UPI003F51EB4A